MTTPRGTANSVDFFCHSLHSPPADVRPAGLESPAGPIFFWHSPYWSQKAREEILYSLNYFDVKAPGEPPLTLNYFDIQPPKRQRGKPPPQENGRPRRLSLLSLPSILSSRFNFNFCTDPGKRTRASKNQRPLNTNSGNEPAKNRTARTQRHKEKISMT